MRKLIFLLVILVCFGCEVHKEITLPTGEWKLKSLFAQDVSHLEKPLTLKRDTTENKVVGFAGCNQYFSKFSGTSYSITFSETGSTKMFCEETMATELQFMTALEQVQSFKVTGNTLIFLADNKVILEFTR